MALIKAVMIPLDPTAEELQEYVRVLTSDPEPLDDEGPDATVDESE